MKKPGGFSAAVLVLFLVVTCIPAGAAAVDVFVRRVSAPSAPFSLVYDMNNAGVVVGVVGGAGPSTGFVSDGSSHMTIGPPGWTDTGATGISGNGKISGGGMDGAVSKGFIYSGGAYTPLLPATCTSATAQAVNNSGQATGTAECGGLDHAFIYNGGFALLLPPWATEAEGSDINGGAEIVGRAITGGGDRGFHYDGTYTEIMPPGWNSAEALKINNDGTVLGIGDAGSSDKCFLYRAGVYRTIAPPGLSNATCSDLNGNGDVLGYGFDLISGFIIFLYHDGRYHLMQGRNFFFQPQAINDSLLTAGLALPDVSVNQAFAALGYILPGIDITARGGDGPVSIPAATSPNLKVAVDALFFRGRPVDWWLFAQTPAGVFSYDFAQGRWRPGFFRTAGLPLITFSPKNIPPAGSAPGAYTYYFGADFNRNGAFDLTYFIFDSIFVFLR